jgi:Family of unknown function (DUF6402)
LLVPGLYFDLSRTLPDLHKLHINFRSVENVFSATLDDMVAALANFSIYVSPIVGEVRAEGARFRVKLVQVGFHVMDSYDFQGSQDLGYWDEKTNHASAFPMWDGTNVTNDAFRNWRASNGRGGDFLVYSDNKILTLNPAESFLI